MFPLYLRKLQPMFTSKENLIKHGFTGFKTINELCKDSTILPKQKGVYVVINPLPSSKDFLKVGTGGHFKAKNPNISVEELNAKWVSDAIVVYIGQAGGNGSAATLQKRIKQYLDFGKGKAIGHYGGRLIWQIKHSKDLLIAWKALDKEDSCAVETKLLTDFKEHYGVLPFANMRM